MVVGRDNLVEDQWKKIWGCTRGFHFLLEQARLEVESEFAWVATPWTSQGRDEAGQWFDRHGRATLLLRRGRDGSVALRPLALQPGPYPQGDAPASQRRRER